MDKNRKHTHIHSRAYIQSGAFECNVTFAGSEIQTISLTHTHSCKIEALAILTIEW